MKKLIVFCLFISISLSACYEVEDTTLIKATPTEATPSPSQQKEETPKPRPSFDNNTIKTSKVGLYHFSWGTNTNIWNTWTKDLLVSKYTNNRLISNSFVGRDMDYVTKIGLELAGQDNVKAIVVLPAIEDIQYTFQAIKEEYPDHLLIAIASKDGMEIPEADIVINYDYFSDAASMPNQAKELGAKTFVYYSYEDIPDKPVIAKHRDITKAECEKIGLQFIEVVIPYDYEDRYPALDEFIREDISKQIKLYGQDINFYTMYSGVYSVADACLRYGTISVFQSTIFQSSILESLIPPYPVILDPFKIPDEEITDFLYINQQIEDIVADKGMTGRLSTWPVSFSHLAGEAAIKYALTYADGYPELKTLDKEFFYQCLKDTMAEFGYPDHNVYINTYDEFGDNYIFISQDYIVY